MNFACLCSSRGTVLQSILDSMQNGSLNATCAGVIADHPDRGCIEKAKASAIPVITVEKREGEDREEYDKRLNAAIQNLGAVDIVAAVGWLWILSPWFITQWKGRILNVHPALLPKHGGAGMYGHKVHQAVLDAGESESGMTIHLVDEGVDTGNILLQKRCPVETGDTAKTLCKRVQELEKQWYPKVLQRIHTGEIELMSSTRK